MLQVWKTGAGPFCDRKMLGFSLGGMRIRSRSEDWTRFCGLEMKPQRDGSDTSRRRTVKDDEEDHRLVMWASLEDGRR